MSKIYYISDLHLGQENIIYMSHRPFSSVEEMDKTLIENWNSVVNDDDHVYILGDLIYRAPDVEKYLKQLKGHLHLIRGNHDRCITNNNRCRKYFDSIDDYLEIVDNGEHVVLFHYPIAEWNGYFRKTNPSIHLYGHIHNNKNRTSDIMDTTPNCYNVGADILGFTPRTLNEIKKMKKG